MQVFIKVLYQLVKDFLSKEFIDKFLSKVFKRGCNGNGCACTRSIWRGPSCRGTSPTCPQTPSCIPNG